MQAPFLSLELEQQPLCLDISPSSPLLATGLVDGHITLHTYSFDTSTHKEEKKEGGSSARRAEAGRQPAAGSTGGAEAEASRSTSSSLSVQLRHTLDAHAREHSCRALSFAQGGGCLVSGSSDRSLALFDCSTACLVRRMDAAHGSDVSAVFSCSSNSIASGDEDGGIKLWDLRAKKMVMSYKKHSDFISGFSLHPKDQCLLASSGDGTLSVHDLRTAKTKLRTDDDADDELLSVAVVKGGKKVIAGTQSGVINIYSWGAMKDCSDRFPGHPESVDAVVKFDEDTVLTGSSDGVVRIINILPNKLLGLVGEHSELPVECLVLAQDRRVLASASHDLTVKLWDMSFLLNGDDDPDEGEEEAEEEDGEAAGEGPGSSFAPLRFSASEDCSGEQVSASEDDDEDDDDDDDDDSDEGVGEDEEFGDEEEGEEGEGEAEEAAGHIEEGEEGSGDEQEETRKNAHPPESDGPAAGQAAVHSQEPRHQPPGSLHAPPASTSAEPAAATSDASDGDSDDEAPKKKRKKAEKTRWRKESKAKSRQGTANFFSGLLD